MLEQVELLRKNIGRQTSQQHKAELGQFITPSTVARFMASLFIPSTHQTARLLDAGAGLGSLSAAFLERWIDGDLAFSQVEISAYEIDNKLREHLFETLTKNQHNLSINVSIVGGDFIEEAVKLIQRREKSFTHAILNPPYKKINSTSSHRLLLRQVEIETVNLYSAFVALAIDLLEPGGQLVAIIPRSFCNGPYYRPFRDLILAKTAIRHMHLFASRDKAFKDDDVLQENIIIVLERFGKQKDINVSSSTDDSFTDIKIHKCPYNRIVFPNDAERFIHVPTSLEYNKIEMSTAVCSSLKDIDLEISTGPVVDFRLSSHLRKNPEPGSVPLLYPNHFSGSSLEWPKLDAKKPNAIMRNTETEKWLYPNGCYVVVRRFSSKEEKRRIVASLVHPTEFDSQMLGFENHLNVFHCGKKGISEDLARGLVMFLNCTAVDEQFRRFSGHTQVNATDLRVMKYPDRKTLAKLGVWAKLQNQFTQEKIDRKIESVLWR
jgi:adenine-specific DNA-methyltransferase